MYRKSGLVVVILGLVLAVAPGLGLTPAAAQGPDGWATYELNMRAGPGPDFDSVGVIAASTGVIFEARTNDLTWLLGHSEDGSVRGWVSSSYFQYQTGFAAARLPVSNEVVGGAAAPAPAEVAPAEQQVPAAEAAPAAENPAPAAPAAAGGVAYPVYDLNVRSGPGTEHNEVGRIAASTPIVLEARNPDTSWVLGHTQDNALRGWLAAMYLQLNNVNLNALPFSDEIMPGGAPAPPPGSVIVNSPITGAFEPNTAVDYSKVFMGGFDPNTVAYINLAEVPIVGQSTARARSIFLKGQEMGNDPHVLAKVGDCSSEHWNFLNPFGWNRFNLAGHTDLLGVIQHFGESLAFDSNATHNGFNINTAQSKEWADPANCIQGESPMLCEFRANKSSVAVIMFGTSDLLVMTPFEYDFFLRRMVEQAELAGVIPILSTFPSNIHYWDATILYNQIVVDVAYDYDVPLINLWLALESLPDKGLEADGFHLSQPYSDGGDLSAANLQTGYAMRNLVTLQTLNNVWVEAMR
ncbi:MAG: hypothetical protein JW966_12220 [Anaerolineae bacterium]|nr:hypothetical protein [Anaerolineae bacterium]